MRETQIGTSEIVEIQGHYGISPFSLERAWGLWGHARSVDDARRTIANLGLTDQPRWDRGNGWRILEVVETAVADDGVEPMVVAASPGRQVETRYEVQGLYLDLTGNGRTRTRSWRRWRTADTLRSARSAFRCMADDIAKRGPSAQGPSEMRLLVVHRDILVIDQPDPATMAQHEVPGAPDPARTALVFHLKGQPCGYGATWADEGYHAAARPQMGPLPSDAHLMRREARLARVL